MAKKMLLTDLYKPELSDIEILDRLEQVIKDSKGANEHWKQSHLLHHGVLKLIEHMQSLQRNELCGIALDLYLDLYSQANIIQSGDWRTHFYFLKVQNQSPEGAKFLQYWAIIESQAYKIYTANDK